MYFSFSLLVNNGNKKQKRFVARAELHIREKTIQVDKVSQKNVALYFVHETENMKKKTENTRRSAV